MPNSFQNTSAKGYTMTENNKNPQKSPAPNITKSHVFESIFWILVYGMFVACIANKI